MRDAGGIEILPTDRVTVSAWGFGARLIDVGTVSPVIRLNRTRVVVIDSTGLERAVGATCLHVRRRDGVPGHESNRLRAMTRTF